MKKLIYFFIVFFIATSSIFPQIKSRDKGNFYMGAGYSLMIFTNSDVYNIYPVVNFNASSFTSELTINAGYKFNKNFSLEFDPGIIWVKAQSNNGFYFNDGINRYFYQPIETNLLAVPLNVKLKVFPLATKEMSFRDNLYFGIGGGVMFLNEQYNSSVYTNNSLNYLLYTRSYSQALWRPDALISLGVDFTTKFGFGFEASYRIVPLATNGYQPLITSVASNLNSFNLALKILVNFF